LEGDGFPRQRAAISSYSASKGLRITRWFEEKGVSRKRDLENRPALNDLIAALHSNGTKIVLIEKLDRLARDLMIQESIIADLQKGGFTLVSVMEPIFAQTTQAAN
jgi:DNA invertase Pin-like site-specific DNA recombinase